MADHDAGAGRLPGATPAWPSAHAFAGLDFEAGKDAPSTERARERVRSASIAAAPRPPIAEQTVGEERGRSCFLKNGLEEVLLSVALGHALRGTRSGFAQLSKDVLQTVLRAEVEKSFWATRRAQGLVTPPPQSPPPIPGAPQKYRAPPPVLRRTRVAGRTESRPRMSQPRFAREGSEDLEREWEAVCASAEHVVASPEPAGALAPQALFSFTAFDSFVNGIDYDACDEGASCYDACDGASCCAGADVSPTYSVTPPSVFQSPASIRRAGSRQYRDASPSHGS